MQKVYLSIHVVVLALHAMFPIFMQLPGDYTEHVFCSAMRDMKHLGPKDCVVEFTDDTREYNSTWLGMLSPFFRTGFHMFPGIESRDKRYMQLQDVDSTLFEQLAELACGFTIRVGQWEELEALFWLADMLRIEVVRWHLERELLADINNDNWYKALRTRGDLDNHIKDRAFSMALRNFEQLQLSAVDEDTMLALVSHDFLSVHTEDAVLRAVIIWIRARVEDDRWKGEGDCLLREIRHDVLAAPWALYHSRDEWKSLIGTCRKRTMRNGFSVPWSNFKMGEIDEDGGSFDPGSVSGSFNTPSSHVWGPKPTSYNTLVSLDENGVLAEYDFPSYKRLKHAVMIPQDPRDPHKCADLPCMALWGNYVVWSQRKEGGLFMWNFMTQTRAYEMESLYAVQKQTHAMLIQCIAVCEPYMLSASLDMIKMWRRDESLSCVTDYAPDDYGVENAALILVTWNGRAITAVCNEIKVTNMFTTRVETKLSELADGDNHFELLVCNQWLYRAQRNGTVTMWQCGDQWPVLKEVQLPFFDEEPRPCMTISGSSLVCGTIEGVVVVLNATDLQEEHRIYCNNPIYDLVTLTNGGVIARMSGTRLLCWVR